MLDITTRDSDAFLASGGECGRLIAERDWSATLGPIEYWCASLRTATSILLASPTPMVMLWGEDGIMIYNDAYSVFAGSRHPDLLGARVREGWPEVADFNNHVMKVGLDGGTLQFRDHELTLHRNQGRPERVWVNLDYSPVPGDDGAPAGVLAVVIETTERVLAEQRFKLRFALDEQLRAATGPEEVASVAARVVSEQLGGLEAGYAELIDDGEYILPIASWSKGKSGPFVGQRLRANEFGSHFADVREGRDVIIDDVASDERTRESRDRLAEMGAAAFMMLPLVKQGAPAGYYFVASEQPRKWSADERGLVREVAERAWASMRRSRAEMALRDSERFSRETSRRLDAILNNTTMAVFLMDDQQHCLFANAAAERLTGYSFEELSARPLHDVIHNKYPDGRPYPLHECPIDRALPERANMQGEELFVHKDGHFYPVAFTASPLLNDDGEAVGTVIEVRSIAEEKARESALRESEERFRNMADNTPVMMWVTDPTGHCTYLNKRWYQFTGQAEGEGEGLGWIQAVHPDDRSIAEKTFLDANGRQEDYTVEFRLRRADGTYRWALDAAAARFDQTGKFLGYVGSVVDIDELREAEQAIRNSEAMLRGVLEQMPVGVVLARVPGGEVVFQNEAAEDILGARILPESADRYELYGGLHEDGRALEASEYPLSRTVLTGETVTAFPMRYRKPDGKIVFLEIDSGMLEDSPTSSNLAICVFSDVTERKKAEQHQRLLIDELSHRAKNLLAIIQSVAQQSFKGQREPAEMVRAFEGRLGALAAAHGILTRERWEAAPIRRVICDTITAVKSDDHRLVIDGPDLLVWPKTAVSLAMAIHELATNALKYGSLSNESGEVAIRWRVEDARLKLEWRERGGPPVVMPDRRGFGSRMIERGLAAELGGEVRIDFQPEGVVCTVDAPLPEERP